jgi:DNA-binding NarL/FixJ family response regulator
MFESFSASGSLPRILVVDDEPMMQEVFRIAFDEIYQVDGCQSSGEAFEAVNQFSYGVAIVDLRLGGTSGVDLLRDIKKISPATQVIILTGHASMDSAISALNDGAFRYLHKPFQLRLMRRAVAEAFERHGVESNDVGVLDSEELARAGVVGRKAEVVQQVLEYKSTKEIAKKLKLSPRTVEKHLESVFHLLGISSRRELVAKVRSMLRGSMIVPISLMNDVILSLIA